MIVPCRAECSAAAAARFCVCQALGIHNAAPRKAASAHAGYVLTQQGDRWAIAFSQTRGCGGLLPAGEPQCGGTESRVALAAAGAGRELLQQQTQLLLQNFTGAAAMSVSYSSSTCALQ